MGEQDKFINEDYKSWKDECHSVYDFVYSKAFDWPKLTTQWLPDVEKVLGKSGRTHRLVFGTNTTNQEDNYLQIAHINLPCPPRTIGADYDCPSTNSLGDDVKTREPIEFRVVQTIAHPGEVNKARYQPQNPNFIATWAPDHNVYVWNCAKHPSDPEGNIRPQKTLKGHTKDGFALEWSPVVEGQLLSGSEDTTICLWDVGKDRHDVVMCPTQRFTHHRACVNDVQYHPTQGTNLFGTVSDDLSICTVDMRRPADKPVIVAEKAHTGSIDSLSFHLKQDMLFATGSADKSVGIFDLRFVTKGMIHDLRH